MPEDNNYPDREELINAPPKALSEFVRLLAGLPANWDVRYFSGRTDSQEIDQFSGTRTCHIPDHDDNAYDVFNIMLSPPDDLTDGLFRIRPDYDYARDAVEGYRVVYSPATCEDADRRWYADADEWYYPGDINFDYNDTEANTTLHSLSTAFTLMRDIIDSADVNPEAAEQHRSITESQRRERRFGAEV